MVCPVIVNTSGQGVIVTWDIGIWTRNTDMVILPMTMETTLLERLGKAKKMVMGYLQQPMEQYTLELGRKSIF